MRKFKIVTIDSEGRDKGRSFLVVEKAAYDAEKWATRALMALSRAGVEVGDDVLGAGALGILAAGLDAFKQMPFEDAEPLLDEMMNCVWYVPDPAKVDPMTGRPITRPVMRGDDFNDGDISEVATLLKLRGEVLELHLGFSIAAALSTMAAAVNLNQPGTSTSPEPAAL